MTNEIDWSKGYTTKDYALGIRDIKPNYNITFHRDGEQIGVLDFNGPEMTFTGDAEESAKVFFDWIAEWFKSRLEQERAAEREACAKVADRHSTCKNDTPDVIAVAIRARGKK